MANVTRLPDGINAEITDDTGSTYIVPVEVAARDYPDAFATEPSTPYARPEPEPAMPDWELPSPEPIMEFSPEEAANPYGPGYLPTIENQLAQAAPVEQEMNFSPEEAGFVDGGQVAAQPMRQSGSVSQSRSESGTRKYRAQPEGRGAPGPVDIRDFDDAAALAYAKGTAGVNMARDAAENFMLGELNEEGVREGGIEERYAAMKAHREETARKSAEMQQAGMQAAADAEARLAQRIEESQKMDTGKVWRDMSASGKITGIMSAGIAGWLNPTGPNSVVEQMIKIADQSAKAQAENMAQERFQIGQESAAIGRLESRTQQGRMQYLENRAVLEANLIDKISMEKSKYSSAITIAGLEQQQAELMNQIAKTRFEHANIAQEQGSRQWQLNDASQARKATERRLASQFRISRQDSLNAAAAKNSAAAMYVQNPLTSQPIGVFRDPSMKTGNQKFQERLAGRAAMTTRMRKFADKAATAPAMYDGPMSAFMQSKDQQELRGEYEDLRSAYTKQMSGAQASEAEVKRLAKALPPFETFFTVSPEQAIRGFLDRQAEDMWIDANVNLLNNKWDPRIEWGGLADVDPIPLDENDYLDIAGQEGSSSQDKVLAAKNMYDYIMEPNGKAQENFSPGSPEVMGMIGEMIAVGVDSEVLDQLQDVYENGSPAYRRALEGRSLMDKARDELMKRGAPRLISGSEE